MTHTLCRGHKTEEQLRHQTVVTPLSVPDRLKEQSESKITKSNAGKCTQEGGSNLTHLCMLGADQLQSSVAEKDLGMLADTKNIEPQNC